MFQNIFTLTLRQILLGVVIAVVAIVLCVMFGMFAYSGIEDQLAAMVAKMPQAMLSMVGMSPDADPSTFVLGEMLNFITPLVVCGLAISLGSASIAGEEGQNTLAVLLGNPRSRVEVLGAKVLALVVLVLLSGGLLWGGVETLLAVHGNVATLHLGAALLHLVALAIFFGAVAAAVGAWTGLAPVATAVAAGLLVVSWLGTGLLPLFASLAELRRALPWYYLIVAHPLHNGVEWTHVGVLAGAAAILFGLAFVGVGRRDLKFGDGSTLLDQIRRHPLGEKTFGKLAGGSSVTNITLRSISEMQTIAFAVAFYTALLAAAVGPLFNSLSDVLKSLGDAFPRALMAVIGFADMSTAEGWYVAEVFSLVAPGVVIFIGTYMGTKALAGEEAARTMGILLANPVSRRRVMLEKAIALEVVVAIVAAGLFAGTAAGNAIGSLGISYAKICAASFHAFAIGVFFGMLALAAGAVTGVRRQATMIVVGIIIFSWATNTFFPVDPALAKWAQVSPLHYYAENNPLIHGIQWGNVALLFAGAAVFLVLGLVAFDRRDLRG